MIVTVSVKLAYAYYSDDYWSADIEIDDSSSLEVLHNAIQEAVEFANDHQYAFFFAREERSRDRSFLEGEDLYQVCISELFPLPKGKKLFYWFDFGDNWIFQISKSRKKPKEAEKDIKYPRLMKVTGIKPIQYPDPDIEWDK